MLEWARKETSELVFTGVVHRNWTNRSEIMDSDGVGGLVRCEEKPLTPKNPFELVSLGGCYTPSVDGGSDALLRLMVIEELKHSMWKVIWDAELGEECINEICVDSCLRQRMRQTLSDAIGVRKRSARDKLFLQLG